MISVFSVVMGVLWLNLTLLLLLLFRKHEAFTIHYGSRLLLFVAVLALIRILLPLDFRQAHVIRSYRILPAVDRFLQMKVGPLKLWQTIMLIWGLGSLVSCICECRALLAERRKYRGYRVVPCAKAERAAEKLGFPPERVVTSPDVPMPMTGGFFSPKIYLPAFDLSEEDYDWVLLHESYHIRHHDSWLKLFYLVLQIVFWWNPIIYYFQRELDTILEFRCDQAVTAGKTQDEKIAYADALLRVANRLYDVQQRYPANVTTFVRTASISTQRVNVILNGKPRRKSVHCALAVVCVALFVSSYLVLIQPFSSPVEDDMECVSVVSRENAYLVRTADNTYELWINGQFTGCHDEADLEIPPLCDLEIIDSKNGG